MYGNYEYGGQLMWWKPGMPKAAEWTDTDNNADRIMISLETLQEKLQTGSALAAVVAELKEVAPSPPPFAITERSAKIRR